MSLDAVAVDELLRDVMPARSDVASMEYVEARVEKSTLVVVMRLVLWRRVKKDGETEERLEITDVKEQQIAFAPASTPFDRFSAYARGWCAALEKVFAAAEQLSEQAGFLDVLMPHDLVKAEVLSLKTAHAAEDFERACLQPSRLGGWLRRAGVVDETAPDVDDAPPRTPPPRVRDDAL